MCIGPLSADPLTEEESREYFQRLCCALREIEDGLRALDSISGVKP